jgi:hypothetical protein
VAPETRPPLSPARRNANSRSISRSSIVNKNVDVVVSSVRLSFMVLTYSIVTGCQGGTDVRTHPCRSRLTCRPVGARRVRPLALEQRPWRFKRAASVSSHRRVRNAGRHRETFSIKLVVERPAFDRRPAELAPALRRVDLPPRPAGTPGAPPILTMRAPARPELTILAIPIPAKGTRPPSSGSSPETRYVTMHAASGRAMSSHPTDWSRHSSPPRESAATTDKRLGTADRASRSAARSRCGLRCRRRPPPPLLSMVQRFHAIEARRRTQHGLRYVIDVVRLHQLQPEVGLAGPTHGVMSARSKCFLRLVIAQNFQGNIPPTRACGPGPRRRKRVIRSRARESSPSRLAWSLAPGQCGHEPVNGCRGTALTGLSLIGSTRRGCSEPPHASGRRERLPLVVDSHAACLQPLCASRKLRRPRCGGRRRPATTLINWTRCHTRTHEHRPAMTTCG